MAIGAALPFGMYLTKKIICKNSREPVRNNGLFLALKKRNAVFLHLLFMKHLLTGLIDFFYPPFKGLMPLQTFRYAACGGANALLGLAIYTFLVKFVFTGAVADFGFMVFETHIASLFISSTIGFVAGFILNRYIVFTGSNLRGRIQLFRYFLSFFFNLLINYGMLKLLVDIGDWDPVLSQVVTILLVIGISYFTQRHFTFKTDKTGHTRLTNLR